MITIIDIAAIVIIITMLIVVAITVIIVNIIYYHNRNVWFLPGTVLGPIFSAVRELADKPLGVSLGIRGVENYPGPCFGQHPISFR